jgi:hypothetical protein
MEEGLEIGVLLFLLLDIRKTPIATLMCRKQASQLLLVLITYSLFHLEEIGVSIISYISPNNISHLLVKVRILLFFVAVFFGLGLYNNCT